MAAIEDHLHLTSTYPALLKLVCRPTFTVITAYNYDLTRPGVWSWSLPGVWVFRLVSVIVKYTISIPHNKSSSQSLSLILGLESGVEVF